MHTRNPGRPIAAAALALATAFATAFATAAPAALAADATASAGIVATSEATTPTAGATGTMTATTQRVFDNVQYVDGSTNPAQQLFIQLPETGSGPYPVLIYIHGGGWSKGNYGSMAEVLTQKADVKAALAKGYAVAAVNYRLTDEAQWPAQILDVKAAVRYLRAHAAEYGLDAEHFAALGASAGGHLAQFLGVTNGDDTWDDATMGNAGVSSAVQAVLSDYGIADLTRYKSTNLLGSGYTADQAKAASPLNYVTADDVPFYIAHAADDNKVRQQISKDFAAKLKETIGADKVVEYYPETGGHGSAAFYNETAIANELDFLAKVMPLGGTGAGSEGGTEGGAGNGSGTEGGSGSADYDPAYPDNHQGENTTDYLMAYFVTAADYNLWEEQVYFATSHDSREWTDLHKATLPVLTSTVGCNGIRDPFLLRSPDGSKFYILATDQNQVNKGNPGCGWNVDGSRKIIIWESTDLVNWSQPRAVDVGSKIPSSAKKEGMVWAPEAVWDEENQQYFVYWSTNSGVDDQYGRSDSPNQYYATTKDFVTFSDPVKWIDRKGYTLDSTMMKADDGYWYRVHNAGIIERTKNLYATSFKEKTRKADDTKEWKYLTQVQSALSVNNKQVEGNEFLVTNKDDIDELGYKYAIVADQFKEEKGFGIVRTNDLAATTPAEWHRDDLVDFHQDPAKGETIKKHGSFLNITSEEYDRIHAAFDNDKWPVTFDAAGGSAVAMETFGKGEKVTKPADPTRDGYTFKGWVLASDATQVFDFDQAIENPTGPINLVAQWEKSAETPDPDPDPEPTPDPDKPGTPDPDTPTDQTKPGDGAADGKDKTDKADPADGNARTKPLARTGANVAGLAAVAVLMTLAAAMAAYIRRNPMR
ncbi:alpha/beta hydrolase fold domain-containing protein [Bifidobacterium saguinibicoloris]|uniref:alpha/beta hydrolase fold domain-containing protein n=1 Tax=Bifidobacterium saguinibicoloris TaxID=2834433 RepID=UPI001C59D72F|nr:alpha/beta hydrolase fold domain-containing protein [Bifidobacterium saguinibicoloris]MBW3080478.1 alpha/beta hydrolase fold domain-containing protein [Bifidobacterium saguinibicoloris]